MTNETAQFLGPEYSWSDVSLELVDVQPLHGGVRVLLPSWRVGLAYVTRITPGGRETKYRLTLRWREKENLCRLCIAHDFLTIAPLQRLGVPDEARPSITLQNRSRARHTIAKWAGESDPRFDAIYAAMLDVAARTKGRRPIPTRFHLWQKLFFIAGMVLLILSPLPAAY